MKNILRRLAVLFCLVLTLALPAFAAGTITPETTMGEIRSDPDIVASGVFTYSKFRDIPELQTYYYNKQTLQEFVGTQNAVQVAAGLNLVAENVEAGRQVTYKLYSAEEVAADASKEIVELYYFPAKTPNAKYALVLSGNISTRTAELKECISTAYELHEKGYAVFALRYRVFQNASDNAPLDDIGRAVQFITEHAKVFDVQTENYAMIGYSSGGHLLGLFAGKELGYRNYNVPRPGALLLAYPINNFNEVRPLYKLVMDPTVSETRYYQYTISGSVDADYPPVYFWYGKNDNTLKLLGYSKQGPALEKALTANGVPHQGNVYQNAAHGIGLGYGTDAEGWLDEAVAFWESQTGAAETE